MNFRSDELVLPMFQIIVYGVCHTPLTSNDSYINLLLYLLAELDHLAHPAQAESEDAMANWIAAVRRCSVGKPGRHTQPSDGLALARQQQERGEEVVVETITTVLRAATASDSREDVLLRTFVDANDCCAECNSQPVT